jgi:hypothetical protein
MKKIRITESQAEMLANLANKKVVKITATQLVRLRESLGDDITKNFKKEFKNIPTSKGMETKPKFENVVNESMSVELLQFTKAVVEFILDQLNNTTSNGLSPIFRQMGVTRGELFTVLSDAGLLGVAFYQYTYNEKINAIKRVIGDVYKTLMNKNEEVLDEDGSGGLSPQHLIGQLNLPATRADVNWSDRSATYQIPSLTDGDATSLVRDMEFFTGREFVTQAGKKIKEGGYIRDFVKKFGEFPKFEINGNQISVVNPTFIEWRNQFIQGKDASLNQMGTNEDTGAASSGAFTGSLSQSPSKSYDPKSAPSAAMSSTLTDSMSPDQEILGLEIGTEDDTYTVAGVIDKRTDVEGNVFIIVTLNDSLGKLSESHLLYKFDANANKASIKFNQDFNKLSPAKTHISREYHDNLKTIGKALNKMAITPSEATTTMTSNVGTYDAPGFAATRKGAKAGHMTQNINIQDTNKLTKESVSNMTDTAYPNGEFVTFDDCVKLNNNKSAINGGCNDGDSGVVKLSKSKKSVISNQNKD